MAVYLTADLHLNDKEKARVTGLTVDEYNNMIIQKWNEIIKRKDRILVLGEVGNESLHKIKDIVSQLNGVKYLLDYDSNDFVPRSMWQWVGFNQVWQIEVHYDTTINDKQKTIWIKNNTKNVDENDFLCSGEKILGNELYKDNKINIALNQWDYCPIEMNTIIKIIEDYSLNSNI